MGPTEALVGINKAVVETVGAAVGINEGVVGIIGAAVRIIGAACDVGIVGAAVVTNCSSSGKY